MTQMAIASHLILALSLLFGLGILLLGLSRYLRRRSGLPAGDVIYEDASGLGQELLHSERLNICGKPDYLLKDRSGNLIPVEVKSGYAPGGDEPYDSHLMQLAAYLLLVEDALDCVPPYGFVRYRDRTLQVDNTDELRERLFVVIDQMRDLLMQGRAHRSHNQPMRCARCSMAHICDERMGTGRRGDGATGR
jgi:CRISPR-associated exonuclease Cas4